MKKLLSLLAFAGALQAEAQIFSEDFSNGIPSTFTLIDNDGLTPAANVSFVNNAWVGRSLSTGEAYAVSTSWYNPAGQADDWMITPAINISSANTYLVWKAGAPDQSFADGYEVRISTTNPAMTSFTTTVFSTPAESAPFVSRAVDLSSYAGQTVYIAFRNNSNDKFLLYVDDIVVDVYSSVDMAAAGIDMPQYAAASSNVNVTAEFTNLGQTITTADFNYSINGGAPVTQSLSGLNVNPTSSIVLTHSTAWTPAANGSYTVKAWLSNLNGTADADNSNDTVTTTVIVANSVPRVMLAEEFSSATCPPCKSWNDNVYNAALANYNTFNNKIVVKYQVPIPTPGDPSHNADADDRRAYYGVNAAPTMVLNGSILDYQAATFADAATEFAQFEAEAVAEPAFVAIKNAYVNYDGQGSTANLSVTADIESNIDMTNGDFRAHIVVMNKEYTYNSAPNGDFEYHHVMRKMLPSSNGTVLNMAAGGSQNITGSHNGFAVGNVTEFSDNLWNHDIEVVIIVENTATNQVMNAAQASINVIGLSEEDILSGVAIFPQPANENLYVKVDEAKSFDITLTNMMGQVVYKGNFDHSAELNTAEFAAGIYTMTIESEGKIAIKKVNIAH